MRTFEQLRRIAAACAPHEIISLANVTHNERRWLDQFFHRERVEAGNVSVYRLDYPSGLV